MPQSQGRGKVNQLTKRFIREQQNDVKADDLIVSEFKLSGFINCYVDLSTYQAYKVLSNCSRVLPNCVLEFLSFK